MILARERGSHSEKLHRLYEGISEGKLAIDGHLGKVLDGHEKRIKAIDAEMLSLERDRELPLRKVSSDHAVEFGRHAKEALSDPKNPLLRAYLRALLSEVVVSAETATLTAPYLNFSVAASKWDGKSLLESVPNVVTKWRARQESNLRPSA